jgi:hypothetical protein
MNQVLKSSAIAIMALWGASATLNAQLEINSYYVSSNGVAEAVSSKSGTKFFNYPDV